MNCSGPNCNFLPEWVTFGPDQFILVVTISFGSWPNHYWLWSSSNQFGQTKTILDRPNCFGHIEGQGIKGYFYLKFSFSISGILAVYRFSQSGKLNDDIIAKVLKSPSIIAQQCLYHSLGSNGKNYAQTLIWPCPRKVIRFWKGLAHIGGMLIFYFTLTYMG